MNRAVLAFLSLCWAMCLPTALAGPVARPTVPRGIVTFPTGAQHQSRTAPRSDKVAVGMMVVHATEAHSNVDGRLGNLTRYLSHMRFTGYELLDSKQVRLGPNGSQTFRIEGGREVSIRLLSRDERRVRMRVQIEAGSGGKLLDTTLSVNRNGTFIVAGPRYRGGILVLPLTARY